MTIEQELTDLEDNALERHRAAYALREGAIDEHRLIFNALSASLLAMGDNAWKETQKFARPAEVLESVYRLKKHIEPKRYRAITDDATLELIQCLNALCSKWHAILFYPTTRPNPQSPFDEGLFDVKAFLVYADEDIRANDAALKAMDPREHSDTQFTWHDAAFKGKGLLPVFWEEVNYARNRANQHRFIIAAEIQRLEALNKQLEDEHGVYG